jgi:hypothetical protein
MAVFPVVCQDCGFTALVHTGVVEGDREVPDGDTDPGRVHGAEEEGEAVLQDGFTAV